MGLIIQPGIFNFNRLDKGPSINKEILKIPVEDSFNIDILNYHIGNEGKSPVFKDKNIQQQKILKSLSPQKPH